MNLIKLSLNTFRHFWKQNVFVSISIAICTTLITGALLIGDSVKFSLLKSAEIRLGATDFLISSTLSFFSTDISDKLNENKNINASSILILKGIVKNTENEQFLNNINLYGIDNRFFSINNVQTDDIKNGETIINHKLAKHLSLNIGDYIIIGSEKISSVSANTPFVPLDNLNFSRRVKVSKIVDATQLGNFNISHSQTTPFNIFVNINWLNQAMSNSGKANNIIISSKLNKKEIQSNLNNKLTINDYDILIDSIGNNRFIIKSNKVFLNKNITNHLQKAFIAGYAGISYFINSFSFNNKTVPYSFISTNKNITGNNDIVITEWLANDLGISIGDSCTIIYYEIGAFRELIEREKDLIVRNIIKTDSCIEDSSLMPLLPGLTNTQTCSEWESGLPINFEEIRTIDEDYWNKYKGTPKAYISLQLAEKLFINPYGIYTFFDISKTSANSVKIKSKISENLSAEYAGIELRSIKKEAVDSAINSTDFSQLFIGLSFFIIISGIILIYLVFQTNLKSREEQLKLFKSIGINNKSIRKHILLESLPTIFLGLIIGFLGAVLYNSIILNVMSGIWIEIVRTDILLSKINIKTVSIGIAISMLISFVSIIFSIRQVLNKNATKSTQIPGIFRLIKPKHYLISVSLILIIIISIQIINPNNKIAFFFISGILLLIIINIGIYIYFLQLNSIQNINPFTISTLNLNHNLSRNFTIVILLSIAVFLSISIGLNKNSFSNTEDKSSGTGGFQFIAETSIEVPPDLNNTRIRNELNLPNSTKIIQLSKHNKDDASCLNLNRVTNPHILGITASELKNRFSFATKADFIKENNIWDYLNSNNNNIIPAIADQTIIKWGLGKSVGDTISYLNEDGDTIRIRLIAGLKPSVFQGHILISREKYLENFPSGSGSNLFLISDSLIKDKELFNKFKNALKDYGIEIETTKEKLKEFYSVTETYLSIFMLLGFLGVFLGTVGLGIILKRSILERKYEIAIMRASGISTLRITKIFSFEYSFLIISGIMSGALSAILAVFPQLSNNSNADIAFVPVSLLIITIFGAIILVSISYTQITNISISKSLNSE